MQDTNMWFGVAIECSNLEVVMETLKMINHVGCWERLAQQALKQGNHKVC
jgi:coatomer subunit alpha